MFNENVFEAIDTKEKAYWLGFLYADGNVSSKGHRIGFCLNIKDIILLERFCDFVGGDRNKIVSYNNKSVIYYYVYSRKMKDDLYKHNVLPDKTHKKEFPVINDDALFQAFLLGFYDGDGVEGKSTIVSGNIDFLKHCCERFNLSESKIILKANNYGSVFSLCFGYRLFIEMLDNYKQSLERKRRTTAKFFGYDEDVIVKVKNRKFEISKEELETLLFEKSMAEIGKMFDVSSAAIWKRCNYFKIDFKAITKEKLKKELTIVQS